MRRREVLQTAAGLPILAGLRGRGEALAASPIRRTRSPRTFLLLHGAWHAAAHWTATVEFLVTQGHRVLAIDLPGHGLKARYPSSYLKQDVERLKTEISPVRGVTRDDCVGAVVSAIRGLATTGEKITVVAHSMSGVLITRAGEEVPELIHRLVYLTAFCPTRLPSLTSYLSLPENAASQVEKLTVGDPKELGAIRLNPRSSDPAYLEASRAAFYNDLTMEQFLPYAFGLSCDLPFDPVSTDTRGTRERWGRIPRTYLRCTQDFALPIALQDLMIKEADEFTPNNRFDVKTLETSHSPFASQPQKLAELLSEIAS